MSPEKMQRPWRYSVAASLPAWPMVQDPPIATFIPHSCDKGWVWGERHSTQSREAGPGGGRGRGTEKEERVHQAGRTAQAGMGGSQSHKDGGAPETLESGQNWGTGEQSSAETYCVLSALMAPPHIASQKTQQEHARSGFSSGSGTLVSAW